MLFIVEQILAALSASLEMYTRSVREAHAGATDEQSKAENKYDTRGLEAGYLARGQSRQAAETEQNVEQFAKLTVRAFGPQDAIDLSALVELDGKEGRAFCTTMGASQDLQWEGTRRLIVNGCLWALKIEEKIPEKTNVDLVGEYKPTPFKFGGHAKGVKPADLFK